MPGYFARFDQNFGAGLISGGRGYGYVTAQRRRGQQQRVRNIVPVAHVCQLDLGEIAELLPQREIVGECLARVLVVAQGVDHRDGGIGGHIGHGGVGKSAKHQSVHPAFDVMRNVVQGSRWPRRECVWSTKNELPPSELMPASKVRRVRNEGFSKNSTICLPANAAAKILWTALHHRRQFQQTLRFAAA